MSLDIWFLITLFGQPEIWLGVVVSLLVGYAIVRKKLGKRRKILKSFLMVFVIAFLITFVAVVEIKEITHIPRPCTQENPYCETDYSFPSGHAALIFSFVSSVALFIRKKSLPLIPLAVLVAYSRVALGVHTYADIVTGSVLGVAISIVVWSILQSKKS